jgi:hypothetical protein
MDIPILILFLSQTLVELGMCMLHPSKGQKLVGYLCQGTGDKTGRVTTILMVKACLLRLPQVMVVLLFPTMLLQLDGLLVKPTLVLKSSRA